MTETRKFKITARGTQVVNRRASSKWRGITKVLDKITPVNSWMVGAMMLEKMAQDPLATHYTAQELATKAGLEWEAHDLLPVVLELEADGYIEEVS